MADVPWLNEPNGERRFIDRAGWERGQWDGEPDEVWWPGADGAYHWAVRNWSGAWCGYVAVPMGHPWSLICDHEVSDDNAEWSALRPDGWTLFGFDCGHNWHVQPSRGHHYDGGSYYATLREVRTRIESLAATLATPPADRAAALTATRQRLLWLIDRNINEAGARRWLEVIDG